MATIGNDLTTATGVRKELKHLARVLASERHMIKLLEARMREVANMLPIELHATECPCGLCESANKVWVDYVNEEIERARYRCLACGSDNVTVGRVPTDDRIGAYVSIACRTCRRRTSAKV
jgi:hypothetical protein